MLRLFIAILLEDKVKEEIDKFLKYAKSILRANDELIRWVKKENLHLTLRFLGDTPPARLASLESVCNEISLRFSPFLAEISNFSAFPSWKRARVIWIGLQPEDKLKRIAEELNKNLLRVGFPPPDKPFLPHITLARIKGKIEENSLEKLSVAQKNFSFSHSKFQLSSFSLMQSILQPTGSVYKTIKSFIFSVK
jgi:2'-5' RNA ligase